MTGKGSSSFDVSRVLTDRLINGDNPKEDHTIIEEIKIDKYERK